MLSKIATVFNHRRRVQTMTCKDCIHTDVCRLPFNKSEVEFAHVCHHFKNKADFVEIPCRCKDCDHFINYKSGGTYCEEHSDGWGDSIVYVDEDDYCSFAIRKKEGADNG
jgi:hypothetical protein